MTALRDMQHNFYKQWPLDTPPPSRNQVEWLGSGPETDTFRVDGHPPVDMRAFTFKGLAAARQNKPGGIKAPRIKSMHPELPSPADKDPFM